MLYTSSVTYAHGWLLRMVRVTVNDVFLPTDESIELMYHELAPVFCITPRIKSPGLTR